MSDHPALRIQGQSIGRVFGRIAGDLADVPIPAETLPAIDMKLTLRLQAEKERGFSFIWTDTTTSRSNLTLELAARLQRPASAP